MTAEKQKNEGRGLPDPPLMLESNIGLTGRTCWGLVTGPASAILRRGMQPARSTMTWDVVGPKSYARLAS